MTTSKQMTPTRKGKGGHLGTLGEDIKSAVTTGTHTAGGATEAPQDLSIRPHQKQAGGSAGDVRRPNRAVACSAADAGGDKVPA